LGLSQSLGGTASKEKRGCSFAEWFIVTFLAFFLGGWPAESQAALSCTASVGVAPVARWEGLAERVADLVFICGGGTPGGPLTANFQIFLNTNITSNLLDHNSTPSTEALLLLNDPAPVLQILGANVFQGLKGLPKDPRT
jgi:hypothetical protein